MQRKFERRAAAVLAVLALTCPALGLAQTPAVSAPPPAESSDAVVAQMAAKLQPPPSVTAPAPVVAAPAPMPTPAPALAAAQPPVPQTATAAMPASTNSAPQTTAPPSLAPQPIAPQAQVAETAAPAATPPRQQTASAQMSALVGPGEVGADYVLGSADKIRITVFGEPSLTGEYFVSSSGKVSLPLAGEVQAAGLTLRDFHDHVVKALLDGYLKDPKVSLEVLTFRPFYILGEVSKPGQYPYTSGLTVFNAVATAGGFTYRANTRKVMIKRASEPAEHELPLTAETAIAPGDTIRIPERFF